MNEHHDYGFGERLRTARDQRNMTQQQLADHAGIPILQIKRYEAGQSQPTVPVLRGLCTALQLSADELVYDDMGLTHGKHDELEHIAWQANRELSPELRAAAVAMIRGLMKLETDRRRAPPRRTSR